MGQYIYEGVLKNTLCEGNKIWLRIMDGEVVVCFVDMNVGGMQRESPFLLHRNLKVC